MASHHFFCTHIFTGLAPLASTQHNRAGSRTTNSKNQSQVVSVGGETPFPCKNTDLMQSGFKVREATSAPPKGKTTTEAASPCAAAATKASQGATLPLGAPLIPITNNRGLPKPVCKSKLPRKSLLYSSLLSHHQSSDSSVNTSLNRLHRSFYVVTQARWVSRRSFFRDRGLLV